MHQKLFLQCYDLKTKLVTTFDLKRGDHLV